MAEFSPMMQRYLETKEQYKDCILFYRLGDFYEMFFEDAKLVSQELDLVLTGRSGSLTLAHSQNSQMSFMYGFFFVKFLFFTVVCVVIVV